MTTPVLVVDDEPMVRKSLALALERAGATVITAADGQEALAKFREHKSAVIFSDVKMPGMDGFALLRSVKRLDPDTPVVLITGFGGEDVAARAEEAGAARVLNKPITTAELQQVLVALLGQPDEAEPAAIITSNPQMEAMLSLARRVAKTDATVLVQGETGTGKEVLARFIHNESARHDGPFVAVNCAALPESLIESELFGHERGSFTGATGRRAGCFETASGGTLLLDEVTEIPLALQAKLLRAIESREIQPVGSTRRIQVQARIVVATNRDLAAEVKGGRFREDLYYRLAVVEIHVPPLRDRREDIPALANHFVQKYAQDLGRGVRGISRDALRLLAGHDWKGNIRQLSNAIERAVIFAAGEEIQPSDLPAPVQGAAPRDPEFNGTLHDATSDFERAYILRVIEECGGNKRKAARRLGLSFTTLYRKLGTPVQQSNAEES